MDPIRLAVGIPAYGSLVRSGHAWMWLSLGAALASNADAFQLVWRGDVQANPVGDARNKLVFSAMGAGADWLLMVDADTWAGDDPGAAMLELVAAGVEREAAIIGAPVVGRGWSGRRTVFVEASPGKQAVPPEDVYRGKVVPCTRVGGAFMAINLGWLRGHLGSPPWFTHEARMSGDAEYRLGSHGEDVAFCDAVRARGGRIFVDGRLIPLHAMDAQVR